MFKRKRLRLIAYWRRWRALEGQRPLLDLLKRADPQAPWLKRVNWLLDLIDWLHYEPAGIRSGEKVRHAIKTRRLKLLLNQIDRNAEQHAAVVAALQSILKDADGLEFFSATGLPREPALMSEIIEQIVAKLLPQTPLDRDLDSLFGALFPEADHAEWIGRIDPLTLTRLRQLIFTGEVAARYRRNAEDALIYLSRVISAIGLNPDVRVCMSITSLRAAPFLKLEDAVKALVITPVEADRPQRLAEARAALFQTRAAVLEAYRHLSAHGVSVFLVYRLQRMRAITGRMDALLSLLFPHPQAGLNAPPNASPNAAPFIAELIRARHMRTGLRALFRRNTALLARKMVEHNAEHGDHYIARDRGEYAGMFKLALGGGLVTAFTVWIKYALAGLIGAKFIEGLIAALNYSVSFVTIQLAGFVLATKQPAMTGPALATSLEGLDHQGGLRALVEEVVHLLRSQSAAVLGNIVAVIPVVLLISAFMLWVSGHGVLTPEKAQYTIDSYSIFGPTPFYAAFTGVLLWASSLFAGYADNWFALRGLARGIAYNRRLQAVFGETGSGRIADFLKRNVGGFAANISLGLLLGLVPAFAVFLGLPLDVRHITLSTGSLTAAVFVLGAGAMQYADFWRAIGGLASMAVLNVGVAFALAFSLARGASGIRRRTRSRVFRVLRWRLARSPPGFFLPTAIGQRVRALRTAERGVAP